jgi:hypothetical protein
MSGVFYAIPSYLSADLDEWLFSKGFEITHADQEPKPLRVVLGPGDTAKVPFYTKATS